MWLGVDSFILFHITSCTDGMGGFVGPTVGLDMADSDQV
jgi:hypothetical protein